MFADIGSFTQTRARRGFPGGSRLAGLRAFPGASGRCGGRVRIPLMNQNLLYLVFKCSFSTKHSGSIPVAQGRDPARTAARKRASETGLWRVVPRISPCFPGLLHRLVHEKRRSSAQAGRCAFATGLRRAAARRLARCFRGTAGEDPHPARICSAARLRGAKPGCFGASGRCTSFVRANANIREIGSLRRPSPRPSPASGRGSGGHAGRSAVGSLSPGRGRGSGGRAERSAVGSLSPGRGRGLG